MNVSATPPDEVLRSPQVRVSHRRTVRVVAPFVLAAACALAGVTVATATSASINNHIPSASGRLVLLCDGECPGFCPCASLN